VALSNADQPGNGTFLYKFNATARALVAVTVSEPANYLNMRVVVPFSNQVLGPQQAGQLLVRPAFSGVYTALVQGRFWDGTPRPLTIAATPAVLTTEPPTNLASKHGPFSIPGNVGTALAFTGLESLQVTDQPAINHGASFTLEAWVNPDRLNKSYDPLIANPNYELYVDNGDRLVSFIGEGQNNYWLYSNWGMVPGNTWTYVVATVDASTHLMTLYANGVQVAQQGCRAYAPTNKGAPLTIGADAPLGYNNSGSWQGMIQQVSLWRVAPTGDQIHANKDADLTGAESGLSLYLPIHDASSPATAADLGPNSATANVVYGFAGLNHVVVGRIGSPDGTATYGFSLAQAAALAFDGLSDDNAFTVTLTGPNGLSIPRNIAQGDSLDFYNDSALVAAPAV
jgi:hypothetical protein